MVAKWADEAARQSKGEGPTNGKKKRTDRQRLKERYAKTREAAQLAGIIETAPEGAVRDEVVKPSTQTTQDTTAIDRAAVSQGWRVPEDQKPKVIQRLLEKLDDPDPGVIAPMLRYNGKAIAHSVLDTIAAKDEAKIQYGLDCCAR